MRLVRPDCQEAANVPRATRKEERRKLKQILNGLVQDLNTARSKDTPGVAHRHCCDDFAPGSGAATIDLCPTPKAKKVGSLRIHVDSNTEFGALNPYLYMVNTWHICYHVVEEERSGLFFSVPFLYSSLTGSFGGCDRHTLIHGNTSLSPVVTLWVRVFIEQYLVEIVIFSSALGKDVYSLIHPHTLIDAIYCWHISLEEKSCNQRSEIISVAGSTVDSLWIFTE